VKAFRFRLEAVMTWRRGRLDIEESKLAALSARRHALERELEQLRANRSSASRNLKSGEPVTGNSLHWLDSYSGGLQANERALQGQLAETGRKIVAQRENVVRARRDYELLTRLKEKQHAAWVYARDREEEAAVTDTFNALRSVR
jgi:flagellar export protein FliJ